MLDVETQVVSSWNITFLGPSGVTHDLSPQDGGVAFAMCCNTDLCPNVGDWKFDFSSGNAFFGIDTASGLEPSMLVSCVLPEVALRLNQRPRKTPGFQTPASKLHASVASTV